MANDLAVYDRVQNPMEFVEKMGTSMAQSGMFGCKNMQQGMVLAMACLTEKKNPIELARTYHIIDGKLSMRADAMLAEFRIRGGKVEWINIGDDGEEARARFSFDGQTLEIAFTIEEAKRMQLVKPNSNWVKNPGAMLRARCVSKAVRIVAPEIVAGVYAPEELGDGEGVRGANGEVIEGEFCWPNASTPAKAAEKEAAPKVDAKELIKRKAAERKAAAENGNGHSLPGDSGEEAAEAAESGAEDETGGQSATVQDESAFDPPFDAGLTIDQLVARIEEYGPRAFGDQWVDAKTAVLKKRGVGRLKSLSVEDANSLLEKLMAKSMGLEQANGDVHAKNAGAASAGANSPN